MKMHQTERFVGARINAILWERGMRQTELAARMGLGQDTLNAKLHARRGFTLDEFVALAAILDVAYADLLPPAQAHITHEYPAVAA